MIEEHRPPENVTEEKVMREQDGRGQLGDAPPSLEEFRLPAPHGNAMRRRRSRRSFMTSVGGRLILVLLIVLAYLAVIKLPLPGFSKRQAGDLALNSTGSSPMTASRREATPRSEPKPRLIVHAQQGNAGEPLPLGITMQGSSEEAVVIIRGTIPGTIFSSGSATGVDSWEIPATQLANTWIGPPSGFAGTLDLVAELQRNGATLGEPQAFRIEWIAASPAISSEVPAAAPVHEPVPDIATTTSVPEAVPAHAQLATANSLVAPVPGPRQPESDKITAEQPRQQTRQKRPASKAAAPSRERSLVDTAARGRAREAPTPSEQLQDVQQPSEAPQAQHDPATGRIVSDIPSALDILLGRRRSEHITEGSNLNGPDRISSTPVPSDETTSQGAGNLASADTQKRCDYSRCAKDFRSFRASDCTYQPPHGGPRKTCDKGSRFTEVQQRHAQTQPFGQQCNVVMCARLFRSFDPSDCTYQPNSGAARRTCDR
jgi:hypothetical protein